jgi:hypothetical protein
MSQRKAIFDAAIVMGNRLSSCISAFVCKCACIHATEKSYFGWRYDHVQYVYCNFCVYVYLCMCICIAHDKCVCIFVCACTCILVCQRGNFMRICCAEYLILFVCDYLCTGTCTAIQEMRYALNQHTYIPTYIHINLPHIAEIPCFWSSCGSETHSINIHSYQHTYILTYHTLQRYVASGHPVAARHT